MDVNSAEAVMSHFITETADKQPFECETTKGWVGWIVLNKPISLRLVYLFVYLFSALYGSFFWLGK